MDNWAEEISLLDPLQYPPPVQGQGEGEGPGQEEGPCADEEENDAAYDPMSRSLFSSVENSRVIDNHRHALAVRALRHENRRSYTRGGESRDSSAVTSVSSFQKADKDLMAVSCPVMPSSGGIYDQYGNSTAQWPVKRSTTSILDADRDRKHKHTAAEARSDNDSFLSELFYEGWMLSKVCLMTYGCIPLPPRHLRYPLSLLGNEQSASNRKDK
jgi:hypothetical protein